MSPQTRRMIGLGAAVGGVLGAGLGWAALRAPSGYAATYTFAGSWFLCAAGLILALLLLIMRRTRPLACAVAVSSVALVAVFYAAFAVGSKVGLRDWWGDRQVAIPPTQPR